jgi:hypothetical protein
MPALLVHLTAAKQTLERAASFPALSRLCAAARAEPASYQLGAIFVDLPYHARFARQLLQHLSGRAYLASEWGDILHTRATGRLALALLAHLARSHLRGADHDRVLALSLGYLSHHALDRSGHPVIQQRVAERLAPGEPPSRLHAELERYQNVFYHLDLGHRIAGGPFSRQAVAEVEGVRLLRPRLSTGTAGALRAALLETHGRAPSPAELSDWLFGIAAYGRLMASPLGLREGIRGETGELRREHYQGPGVNLASPIPRGIELTLEYFRAALALLDADRLTREAREVFLHRVPDVDLGTGA